PVLVVNLYTVFGRDGRHESLSSRSVRQTNRAVGYAADILAVNLSVLTAFSLKCIVWHRGKEHVTRSSVPSLPRTFARRITHLGYIRDLEFDAFIEGVSFYEGE
ncbi:MAG TPA: hypothetical protein VKR43_18565, partial [Bryobacteraceae bacterium]|nr:hypothetical protein [Bryobacteraceae bacterium]